MNTYNAFTPFGWPIVIYLTLAGLACGASLCAVLFLRSEKKALEAESYAIAKTSLTIAIGSILLGAVLLLFDLQNSSNFYLNFVEFNPSSAIAWGTRIITIFVMLCIFSLVLLNTVNSEDRSNPIGPILTSLLVIFALATGAYTAFVLGQGGVARPLWEPLILMPLFLLLGLHSGFALVQLLTFNKWTEESLEQIRKLDLSAIVLQIILFILLISITSFSSEGKDRLFSGEFALWFWIGVVFIGWVLPFIINSMSTHSSSFSDKKAIILSQLCFICGAFALRAVIVFSGQGAQAFAGT